MAGYAAVKAAVIDVIDDFTKKDVLANYKPKGQATYNAKTKLVSLAINETTLAAMETRFNKALSKVCGVGWKNVGAFDMVKQATIGDLIWLACAASNTRVPAGEPT